jgi:hypothetical protein
MYSQTFQKLRFLWVKSKWNGTRVLFSGYRVSFLASESASVLKYSNQNVSRHHFVTRKKNPKWNPLEADTSSTNYENTIFFNLGESLNFGSIFVSVKHFYTPSFSSGMIVFHCISFKQNHYNNIKSKYGITVKLITSKFHPVQSQKPLTLLTPFKPMYSSLRETLNSSESF